MQTSFVLQIGSSNYIGKLYDRLDASINSTFQKLYTVNNSNNTFRYYQNTSNSLQNAIQRSSNILVANLKTLDNNSSNNVVSITSNLVKIQEKTVEANIASNIRKLDSNQSNYVAALRLDQQSNIMLFTADNYRQLSYVDYLTSNTIQTKKEQLSTNIASTSNLVATTIHLLNFDQIANGSKNKFIIDGVYNDDLTISNLTVKHDIVPDADGVYDLGSPTHRWNGLYLSGNTIYIDNVALSSSPETSTLSVTNNQLPQEIITRSVKLLDTGTGKTSIMQSVNNQITVGQYDPDVPDQNYVKRLTADDVYEGSSNIYFKADRVGAISYASNVEEIANASNVNYDIILRINSLKTRDILLGSSNQYIINGAYNSNLLVIGTITACNLEVIGDETVMKTGILQTTDIEILSHSYADTALTVIQNNGNQNIIEFNSNLIIRNDGKVRIGNSTTSNVILSVAGNIKSTGTVQGITSNQLSSLQGVASNIQKQCDNLILYGSNYTSNVSNLVAIDLITTSNNIASRLTSIGIVQSNVISNVTKWMEQLCVDASNLLPGSISKLDNDTSNLIVGKTLDAYGSNVLAVASNLDVRITSMDINISNYVAETSNSVRKTLSNTSNTISGLVSGILGNRWQQGANTIYYQNYVGIGTNNPQTNLDIVGDLKFSGSINNVTSNQLNNLRGLSSTLQTQIDNISTTSSNNTSNTFDRLNSNLSSLFTTLASNVSNIDVSTSNFIGSNYITLNGMVTSMTNSLTNRINNLNFSQWKTTSNGIYFMNSVGIGTSTIGSGNRLEIFGGDLNINTCNIEKSIYVLTDVKKVNPVIWYKFDNEPLLSNTIYDCNIWNTSNFNLQIKNAFFYSSNHIINWYQFNSNFNDTSTSNYNLQNVGNCTFSTEVPNNILLSSYSVNFDGSSYLMQTSPITSNIPFSFGFWVYLTNSNCTLVSSIGESSKSISISIDASLSLGLRFGDFFRVFNYSNDTWYIPAYFYLNKWNSFYMYGAASRSRVWVNGIFIASTGGFEQPRIISPLVIGASSNFDNYLPNNSKIADFRIYNRTLTDDEVKIIYSCGINVIDYAYNNKSVYYYTNATNLVAWYKFDNNTTDLVLDSSGQIPANDLTNFSVGIETSSHWKGTACAKYSNTGQFFQVSNNGKFSTDNFTISTWVYFPSRPEISTLTKFCIASCQSFSNSIYTGWAFNIVYNNSNKSGMLAFETGDGITNILDGSETSIEGIWSITNVWSHLSIVLSRIDANNAQIKLFINGNLINSVTRKYAKNNGTNMRIGAGNNWTSAGNFFGYTTYISYLDDFRYYNRSLADYEIKKLVGITYDKVLGYTTNYSIQSAHQWNSITSSDLDNVYLEYTGDRNNLKTLLEMFHTNMGFTIHFVFSTLNGTSTSQLLYIANIAKGNLIRIFITNTTFTFMVGSASATATISANTPYITDLLFTYVNGGNIILQIYFNGTLSTTNNSVAYSDLFKNISTTGLVYYIGEFTDINDATPITLQDFRIYTTALSSSEIQFLKTGNFVPSFSYVINNYQLQRWTDSPTYYDITYGSKYITYMQGNVGIGTTNPSTLLHIGSGSYNTGSMPSASYFTYNTSLTTNASTTLSDTCSIFDSSILVKNTIAASSDTRIKKNIKDIEDDSALQKIMAIQPKTYNYIDPLRGNQTVFGFIAQQIKEVIPEAIKLQRGIVPNIFCVAECFLNVITFPHNIATYNLAVDMRISIVSILDQQYQQSTYTITRVNTETKTITLDRNINSSKVFVYGTEVDDFHSLDKSYIYTLNVCATQKLSQKVDNLLSRLAYLEHLKNSK
jgi:hypothetical protein